MKKLFLILIIFVTSLCKLGAQSKEHKDEYLYLSLGQGYIDGLIWLNWFPTIGIGYEKEINRFYSVNFHIYSYLREYPDSYFTDDANGHPIMDIIVEDAWGPFVTAADKNKIKSVGIKDIDPRLTIKEFSLPVTLNLNFNAIRFWGHNLGIIGGIGFCYSTNNYSKDYFPIKRITLNDGTEYVDVQLSMQTEFRSFDPFLEHIALFYEFKSKNFKLGFKFGEYGYYFGNIEGAYSWDSSVFIKLKL